MLGFIIFIIIVSGGGSSVAVMNGVFIDQPTCKDTAYLCERAVTSFACVRREVL